MTTLQIQPWQRKHLEEVEKLQDLMEGVEARQRAHTSHVSETSSVALKPGPMPSSATTKLSSGPSSLTRCRMTQHYIHISKKSRIS